MQCFPAVHKRSEKSNDSDAALSTAKVSCPATALEDPWSNRYGSCTPPTATLKRSLIWCFEHQWDGNHGMMLMTSENTCERKLTDEHECGKFTIYICIYIYCIYNMIRITFVVLTVAAILQNELCHHHHRKSPNKRDPSHLA